MLLDDESERTDARVLSLGSRTDAMAQGRSHQKLIDPPARIAGPVVRRELPKATGRLSRILLADHVAPTLLRRLSSGLWLAPGFRRSLGIRGGLTLEVSPGQLVALSVVQPVQHRAEQLLRGLGLLEQSHAGAELEVIR